MNRINFTTGPWAYLVPGMPDILYHAEYLEECRMLGVSMENMLVFSRAHYIDEIRRGV